MCHNEDPASGRQKVQLGVSAAVLTSAYGSVRSMNFYTGMLTTANTVDIAAFIKSRVMP